MIVDFGNERRCVEIFCQLMMNLMVGNETLADAVFIAGEVPENVTLISQSFVFIRLVVYAYKGRRYHEPSVSGKSLDEQFFVL